MLFPSKTVQALAAGLLSVLLSASYTSKVSGSMITSRRLQYVEDCSECTMFTISPNATFTIHGFQFYTELTTCLEVEVWYVY